MKFYLIVKVPSLIFYLKQDDSDFIYSVNEAKKKVSTINFIKFETKSINAVLDYMEKHLRSSKVTITSLPQHPQIISAFS